MKADLKKLDLAMAKACMTISEIAEKADISEWNIKNLRSGKSIRPATFGKIAKALGVNPADLIKEE